MTSLFSLPPRETMTSSSHQHIFCTANFFEDIFFLSFFLPPSAGPITDAFIPLHIFQRKDFFPFSISYPSNLFCVILTFFFILISFEVGVGVGVDFIGGYEPLPCLLSHQQPLPRRYRLDAASVRRAQIALSQPSHPLKPPRA